MEDQGMEPGYSRLWDELSMAFNQARRGKGRERHARKDEPFDQQVILRGGRALDSIDGQLYQAIKKIEECKGLRIDKGDTAAITELYGAIVYLAAACLLIREGVGKPS